MLSIVQLEEIEAVLLRLPNLVGEQAGHGRTFAASAAGWLASLESVLTANRLYQAGDIAALRSSLSAAVQGQVPSGVTVTGRPTRGKIAGLAASHVLRRASEIASGVAAENRPRFSEAERLAQQIISAALAKNVVHPADGVVSGEYLQTVRRDLRSNPELGAAVVHLEGLLGSRDTLVFLDRALTAART